ncbi:hypothetical protein Pogu_2173 [Pyrobaculum oguniense TE7]|uniref:Uncharacterized protein n=1 Tax=Pyrobaculum oguniense (strain DSM 13380 / JCM 10595 / TE7) TaxID=698757 RepID=H6QBC4_PYROT|nr:hypothetical protein Pogu_2173 [Pyrobaculum oguniense TE7]
MSVGGVGNRVLKAVKHKIITGAVLVLAAVVAIMMITPGSASPSSYYVSKDGRVAVYLAGSKSGNTTLVLEVVDERGDPLNFTAFLSGPTADKFEDIAVVKGRGRGKVAIGRYVAEAAKLARKLGYKPEEVRFGVVAFVTAVERAGNETYLLTDIVSIPIGPGEAVGKEVVAKIKFKPKFKTKLNATPPNDTAATAAYLPMGEEATQNIKAQSSPPGIIDMGCTAPIGYVTCYRYRVAESYSATEGTPLLITYIDSHAGNYIENVDHVHYIYLSTQTATSISFEMSFAVFQRGVNSGDYSIEAIGPGFDILLGQDKQKTILDLKCGFKPYYPAACFAGPSIITPVFNTFSGDALLATGFVGDVRAVRYVLEQRWCVIFFPGAVFCGTWQPTSVEAWGVWLAGFWGGDTFLPYAEVEDHPRDGQGKLEYIYSTTLNLFAQGHADRISLPSITYWKYVITWKNMVETSQSTNYFAVAIPVGAIAKYVFRLNVPGIERLSAGVSVTTTTLDVYNYYAFVDLRAKYNVPWSPYYYELKNYFIRAAGKNYDVPVPVVDAYIPPRS